MATAPYTLKAIVASQNLAGQRLPWLFRYVFIPLAWLLTWIFLRLGIGPNQTSFIRLACLIISFALIAQQASQLQGWGVGLFLFAVILDNVDGCICRVTNTASYFGKFLDGLIDSIMEVPLPIVLAFGYWGTTQDPGILVAGVIATLTFTLMQITMLRFGLISKDVTAARERGEVIEKAFQPLPGPLRESPVVAKVIDSVTLSLVNFAFDFRYFGLLVAAIFGLIGTYLYILAALHGLLFVTVFIVFVARAADVMNGRRRSKTAADPAPLSRRANQTGSSAGSPGATSKPIC